MFAQNKLQRYDFFCIYANKCKESFWFFVKKCAFCAFGWGRWVGGRDGRKNFVFYL